MESRKRIRRPVVCNVCRRRKIRCDREKPFCTGCRKSNVTHMCIYEEPGEGSRGRGSYSAGGSSPELKSDRLSTRVVTTQLKLEQQQQLQKQQMQFQQSFLQQQLQQQNLQHQMAAKYSLSGGNDSNGMSLPRLSDQLGVQLNSPTPPSYNVTQNLQVEWEYLRKRMNEIESNMGVPSSLPPFGQQLPFHQVFTPDAIEPDLPILNQLSGTTHTEENVENIDPSLFDPDEILTIHQHTLPKSKYLKLESSGIFGNDTYVKKDIFQTLVHLNLEAYNQKLTASEKARLQRGDKFDAFLNNKCHNVEEAFKHSPTSINDLVKRIAKVLPSNKIVWLIIIKFFKEISYPLIPVLNEAEFIDGITKIIGERQSSDQKINLKIDINDNKQIVDLTYLTIIIRIVQISLLTTTKLDKQNNFLLKNSQISNEFDSIIEVLILLLKGFNIDQLTQLKLALFEVFLSLNNFYGNVKPISGTTVLAFSLNLNNKYEVGEDPTLAHVWYYAYFNYYTVNQRKGLPIMLSEELFNQDLIFNPGLGEKVNESLHDFFLRQIEINNVVQKVINKFNDLSTKGIPFTTVDRLLQEYDDVIASKNGEFQSFKKPSSLNLTASNPAGKIFQTQNHIYHILIKLNVIGLCLLHFENSKPKDRTRLKNYMKDFCNILAHGISDIFDLLKNYTQYYHSGYEFVLFPLICHFFERVTKYIQALYIRTQYLGRGSLELIKLLANTTEELEGFPVLQNYFDHWRTIKRTKLMINILKKDHLKTENRIPIFDSKVNIDGHFVDFEEKIHTLYVDLNEKDIADAETAIAEVNREFDTKYSVAKSVEEFFEIFDSEEPAFDVKLFY